MNILFDFYLDTRQKVGGKIYEIPLRLRRRLVGQWLVNGLYVFEVDAQRNEMKVKT